jgi:hypothetical protein
VTATPNVPLLRATMDHILAHPDLHNQAMWATRTECGTAYCFAGTACFLSGFEANQQQLANNGFTRALAGGSDPIEIKATWLLGVDEGTASALFCASNTVHDLKEYVDQIAEHGRIVEPLR